MKNLFYLLLLSLVTIANQSCNDNDQIQTFEPSLDLEEYVLLNFDGIERIYTTDNSISVNHYYQGEEEEPRIMISLSPEPNTYTHFLLTVKNPAVGDFDEEQLDFNVLDYPLDESFPMFHASCNNLECEGNMEVTIHEYGGVGEKMIGEFSGTLSGFNDPENADQSFEGEFVVFIDE